MSGLDWDNAPEDAEFFARDYFRKVDIEDERYCKCWDHINNMWFSSAYTVLNCREAADYEVRPVGDYPVCTPEATPDVTKEGGTGAIKSDGGSSSYYDIPIPDWLFDKIYERRYVDGCYIKTEELIEVLGGNFDEGNILKCLVRINSLRNGKGKEGNSVDYDCNKIIYSANRIKEVCSR